MSRRRPRPGRRLPAIAVVVLALFGGAWWALEAFTGGPSRWAAVGRGDLTLTVDVNGRLKAVDTDLIGPPKLAEMWQYKIAFMAPEGDAAARGDRVLAFDASELEQRLQQEVAEADAARKRVEKAESEAKAAREQDELTLAEAEARLRKTRLKVERPDDVVAAREQALIRLDLELAEKEVAYLRNRLESHGRASAAYLEALRYQLAQAEQQVAQTQDSIEQMVRMAPRDGTVVYVTDWQDQKKSVGDTAWRGESVLELPDLSRMKAMGEVHEADAGRIAVDQRVSLRLDAHPDVEFEGRIARIWNTVERQSPTSALKIVRVEIELAETDQRRMRPGMRFRGTVDVEQVREALLVPTEAVFVEGDGPVVYRKTWGGHEAVSVELGRRDDDEVEVLGGLEEGDVVALEDPRGGGAA